MQAYSGRRYRILFHICAGAFCLLLAPASWAQQPPRAGLSQLTPQQMEMVRPLLELRDLPPSGDVVGFVKVSPLASGALRDPALRGARVVTRAAPGAPEQNETVTDGNGRFHIPVLPAGSYEICASLDGFVAECAPVAVASDNLSLPDRIVLRPAGRTLQGCVTLLDGTPASRTAVSPHQSQGAAEVRALNDDSRAVAGPVRVNTGGCYVLPLPADARPSKIAVDYEQTSIEQALPTDALALDIALPVNPPEIAELTVSQNGNSVSRASPGSTVDVTVTATSPRGLPLEYKWADGTGQILPGNEATLRWRLPATNSTNTLFIEITDSHGGVARTSLEVSADTISRAAPTSTRQFQHPGLFIDPDARSRCGDASQCAAMANLYYQAIGVFDASNQPLVPYQSFGAWKAAWGFGSDPTRPAPEEVRAVFYNDADLQFGRDMHCLTKSNAPGNDPALVRTGDIVVVCYVTNYSASGTSPGSDPLIAIKNAERNVAPFAAVAMIGINEQDPVPGATPDAPESWKNRPIVDFIVFAGPSGSTLNDFVPTTQAVLDGDGAKAVPGLCMSCHGGTYIPAQNRVKGARFLPFDTPSFLYDNASPEFSLGAQSEAFRRLNQFVRNIGTETKAANPAENVLTSQTVRDQIAGWYGWCGGVDATDCKIDDVNHPFIPGSTCTNLNSPPTCGWDSSEFLKLAYQQVPRTHCRMCHVANSDRFNMQNFERFKALHGQVCDALEGRRMPFAEVPYNKFWGSTLEQFSLTTLLRAIRPSGRDECVLTPPDPK